MHSRSLSGRATTAGLALAALLTTGLTAGCSSDGGSSGTGGSGESSTATPPGGGDPQASPSKGQPSSSPAPAKGSVEVVETVAEGLDSPWGLAPLPGGDLLVSSRDGGTIVRIAADDGKQTELGEVPGADPGGEGGLLGIAVSPDFGSDRYVYAYVTTASDNRVVRMRYEEDQEPGGQLGAPSTVFKGIPKGTIHNGGRIAFGPDKMLYVGTGESGEQGLSQDQESWGGKILRMTADGEPAGHGSPEADSVLYSYGHRNVQGLAWDADKRLWASEFGQETWDELNLIRPGENYGWPDVEGKADDGSFTDPVEQWATADASPSGLAFVKGSLWMAGLRGERLWRIPLNGTKPAAEPQSFLDGKYGRLRSVVPAGGSQLWLLTSNTDGRGDPADSDDRLLRLKVT